MDATGSTGEGPLTNAEFLLRILGGKYRVQALSTVAALGVPDALAEGSRDVEQLAAQLGCDAKELDRLLLFTAGLGFLERSAAGTYRLTDLGQELRSDALGPLAAFVGAPEQWDPWARLRETLRGEAKVTPFEATLGVDLYEYLEREPEAAARYDLAIDAFTGHEADALCHIFDFSGSKTLVDVGGGRGKLLHEVLRRFPELAGVLLDRPHVIERARDGLLAELSERVTFHGGDFFEDLPEGHDFYCLKHVLHNWDDERAARLLSRCAQAMSPDGRVLVIEAILSPDHRPDLARMLDLEMSVLTGGRARRKPEFRRLFKKAGLALESVQPVGPSWLLVGAR